MLLLAAATSAAFAAEPIFWGAPVNGLRLGIAFVHGASQPAVRVVLQNLGPDAQKVPVGWDQRGGSAYNIEFTAARARGNKCQVFDRKVLSLPPSPGFVVPVIARIEPGATHELLFPLKQLLCVENRKDVTLDVLWNRNYSLKATLEVDGTGVTSGSLSLKP